MSMIFKVGTKDYTSHVIDGSYKVNKIPKYKFSYFFLLLILLRCFVILIPLKSSLAGAIVENKSLMPWVIDMG